MSLTVTSQSNLCSCQDFIALFDGLKLPGKMRKCEKSDFRKCISGCRGDTFQVYTVHKVVEMSLF